MLELVSPCCASRNLLVQHQTYWPTASRLFSGPEVWVSLDPRIRNVAYLRIEGEQIRLARLNTGCLQFLQLLQPALAQGGYELLRIQHGTIGFCQRFHGDEDKIDATVLCTIHALVDGPVRIGNCLFVAA